MYFLHLHVLDSDLNPSSLDFWRTWDAAVADGGVCSALLSTQISLLRFQAAAGGLWAIAGEGGNCCRCLLEETAHTVTLSCSWVPTHCPRQSSALK